MQYEPRRLLIALGCITGVIGVVVFCVGIWKLGWFIEEKNTEQKVHIINKNPGTQTAWHDKVVSTIADIETLPENAPARKALIKKGCELAGRLSDDYVDDDIEEFQNTFCLKGKNE